MIDIFLFSLIASAALLASGAIGSWIPISKKAASAFQHFAAGVVFAAVATELLPLVVSSPLKIDIAAGFLIGMAAMLGIRLIDQKSTSSFGMAAGIGIDLFVDGLLIGLAFSTSQKSGILILIALTIEVLSLGLSLMPTLIRKNLSAAFRAASLFVLCSLIPVGAVIGALVISIIPHEFYEAALAFGVSALLYLVTEELLVEAHETRDTLWTTASFFVGFLAIMLLH